MSKNVSRQARARNNQSIDKKSNELLSKNILSENILLEERLKNILNSMDNTIFDPIKHRI